MIGHKRTDQFEIRLTWRICLQNANTYKYVFAMINSESSKFLPCDVFYLAACLSIYLVSLAAAAVRACYCDNICPEKYLHFTQSCLASSQVSPVCSPCGGG